MLQDAVGASSHTMTAQSRRSLAAVDRPEMLHLQLSRGTGTGNLKREWAVRPPGRSKAAILDIAADNAMRPPIRM
eukprot:480475-Pyramimonas_sp.AAC.1